MATIEEIQRRAAGGHRAPSELMIVLHLNEVTGFVVELEVRKRYGWVDT